MGRFNIFCDSLLINVGCDSRNLLAGLATVVITELYIASLGSINTVNMVRARQRNYWHRHLINSKPLFLIVTVNWQQLVILHHKPGLHNGHLPHTEVDRPAARLIRLAGAARPCRPKAGPGHLEAGGFLPQR